MNYSSITLSHFETPKNVGRILGKSNVVHTLFGSPESHLVVTFDIQTEESVVSKAKFKAYGGVNVIAGASFLTDYSIGKNVNELRAIVDVSFLLSNMQWPLKEMPTAISLVNGYQKTL